MQKNDPAFAFMATKAKIDAQLVRLTAASNDHFDMAPAEVTWGHVTLLNDMLAALSSLHG